MDAHAPATRIPDYSRARLKHVIAAGNVAAFAIVLWTIFFPTHFHTPALVLCILLPLLGLALDMRARGALGFEARRRGRYPLSLATILLAPGLALALRAGIDLNFESYPPLIAAAALTALAMFAVFWRFDPQLRGDVNQCTTIALFAVVYSYGVLAFADVVLDPSSGSDTQTAIDHKRIHVSGGPKGSSVWYEVKLDPQASPAGANWIHIQPDLWASFQRGDTVCVHFGTGLLAIPWYGIGRCPE